MGTLGDVTFPLERRGIPTATITSLALTAISPHSFLAFLIAAASFAWRLAMYWSCAQSAS